MKDPNPNHTPVSWTTFTILGLVALGVLACRPGGGKASAGSEAKPGTAEADLLNQLKPVMPPPAPGATAFTAPPWKPNTIFPVPVRTWLPPAETGEKAGRLPGDQRPASSSPVSLPESPLPAPDVTLPEPRVLPARDLAFATAPDPALVTVWIATSPAPETRGRPPASDRPQLATDPTAEITRAFPVTAPTGLRETPPPFLRIALPDPFEQISIAELRPAPPEIDPPVLPFTRPANPWPGSAEPAK